MKASNQALEKLGGYTRARANKIREQLNQISNEDLVYWADSIYHSSFSTPREHIEDKAKVYQDDITPF